MSYLSLLIAWFMMRGSELSDNAWWNTYFDTLVHVEEWFLGLSWWIFGIVAAVAIVLFAFSLIGKSYEGLSSSIGCGCLAVFLITIPLWEWITLLLSRGMADSFTAEGITNSGRFVVSLVLYILLGSG